MNSPGFFGGDSGGANEFSWANKTSENMVCAGEGPMNSPGFFGGDSGGPLSWLETETDEVKLYGIVSHNTHVTVKYPSMNVKYRYGVYTKLEPMVSWVNKETGHCNRKTCEHGLPQQINCMTGTKLDSNTKRK